MITDTILAQAQTHVIQVFEQSHRKTGHTWLAVEDVYVMIHGIPALVAACKNQFSSLLFSVKENYQVSLKSRPRYSFLN